MIPYFPARWTYVELLGRRFFLFGLLAAVSLVVFYLQLLRRGRVVGLRVRALEGTLVCMLVLGLVCAHLVEVALYHPAWIMQRPQELLLVHHGLSSYGGLLGVLLGSLGYFRWNRLDPWKHADAISYAFPSAWLVARMGCAMVHDHPGRRSESLFAVNFPRGPRFDLGLLEFALTPLLWVLVVSVGTRTRRPGAVAGALALAYAFMRFPLDFLRATDLGAASDPRYAGLTPAQWGSLGLFALGGYLVHHARTHPEERAQSAAAAL